MRIGAIIQARTTSTRLPGKVLLKLPYDSDTTVLEQVIRRVKRSSIIDDIVVATTRDSEDDAIVPIAKKEDVRVFRGDREDVLSRFYFCAKENRFDIIVRITSDCPCIDWSIIDMVIERHIDEKADYTSNTLIRSFPHGLDVEVISFYALEIAFFEARDPKDREHVCPYIYTKGNDRFRLAMVLAPDELNHPDIRVTLDTIEDYALLSCVYDYLYPENPFFDSFLLVRLFKNKPWLKFINSRVMQKRIFNSLKEEVEEAIKLLRLQELNNVANLLTDMLNDMGDGNQSRT